MEALSPVSSSLEQKLGVSTRSAQWLAWFMIIFFAWVALQIIQALLRSLTKKRMKRGESVLILGPCNAGKTSLFFQLREGREVTTVSSMKPIRDKFEINLGGGDTIPPVDVIDYPGHQRLRGKAHELLAETRCIIYVVDSEDKARLREAADHLYDLLTHRVVSELNIPILIACNKMENPSARSEGFILTEIEREIQQMRISRSATLEGQDQADSFLGVEGQKFKLFDHSPCPVQMCRVSVKKAMLKPIHDFLKVHLLKAT